VRDSGARMHFIDDRWDTIRAVHAQPDLAHIQLYLADWWVQLFGASAGRMACEHVSHAGGGLSAWRQTKQDDAVLCRGYNLPHERQAAAALPGVRLLTLPQCCELLRWGIIMEVRPSSGTWHSAPALLVRGCCIQARAS
jgi:hypothetical protein